MSPRSLPRGWSEIPPDLCSVILSKLDLLETMNFAYTCKSWAVLVKHLKVHIIKSGTPTLLTSRPDQDGTGVEERLEGMFGIHDVSKGKSFCCRITSLQERFWIGGKNDWLVTSDYKCDLKLVNPVTSQIVPLPSFLTMDGVQIYEYLDISIVDGGRGVHLLRRIVLCETPSSSKGYLAIALFSDGFLAYTCESVNAWTRLDNPVKEFRQRNSYYHHVYLDAIEHEDMIVAVDEDGVLYAWALDVENQFPIHLDAPEFAHDEDYDPVRVFYLAKSTSNQLLLICMYGPGQRFYNPSRRIVGSEVDRLEYPEGITVHELHTSTGTWKRMHNIGHGSSIFVGLNYPFHGTWSGIKSDCVYVANMIQYDVLTFRVNTEGGVSIDACDYPADEDTHLLDGHTMRTPMWFRPTVPWKQKV